MNRWIATFYVWPYDGVARGNAVNLSAEEKRTRGAKDLTMEITAGSFDEARLRCQDILAGINLDERVWQAGINGLIKVA